MGIATTRPMDRIAAAMGLLEKTDIIFECCDDIPNGVVLGALPALLGIDLLRHAHSHFTIPAGYYPLESICLLLAYLALGRVPEVKTLRETALVHLARETLRRSDDARSFVRGLLQTTINLRPDHAAGELRIELHGQANPAHDAVVTHLCEELNATETHYPGTKLRLKYIPLRSSTFLLDQDV